MLKIIASILAAPLVIPLRIQLFLSRRRRLRQLKRIRHLRRELRLTKEHSRILDARFERLDPEKVR